MLMFELSAFRLRPSGFGATSLPLGFGATSPSLGFGVTRPSPKVKLYTKIVRLPPTPFGLRRDKTVLVLNTKIVRLCCFATTARQPTPFALRLAEP